MEHDSGDRTEALLAMWSRVKGDNATRSTYVIIIIAIVSLIAGYFVSKTKKRKKISRSHRR